MGSGIWQAETARRFILGSIVNSGSSSYTLSYGYDALGRVVSRAIDGSTNTETTVYDALGRVTQVANADVVSA
jgi:YD repeat-containing protein